MRRFKLSNGLTVVHEKRNSDIVAIEVCVGVGSNNESSDIAGISHFLEHMTFEGTQKRSSKEISEAIENIGGEMNAATSNERTFFYFKLPKKYLKLGLEILSDMLINPAFELNVFEKEKRVVLEEIKMVDDQPLMYQWVLFQKTLFKKHPSRNPVYGRVDSVSSITPEIMRKYHDNWYVPNNMTLCIIGDVKNIDVLTKKYFGCMKSKILPKIKTVVEPKAVKPTIKKEKRDIEQAYFVLGFNTTIRKNPDSYALDVISAIFHKGLSGRINEEIRVKRGLAYAVGSFHEARKGYGLFGFYLNCAPKNVSVSKKIILEELKKLDTISKKELSAAKEYLIGKSLVGFEDSVRRADILAFWNFIENATLANDYLKCIRKVTHKDIVRVRNKYLHKNYTQVLLAK